MDTTKLICLYLLYRQYKKLRKYRRLYRLHRVNMQRNTGKIFKALFKVLREDDAKFLNYFRMPISSFDKLHDYLKPTLQRQNIKMRNCLSSKEMLGVTLRYLGSGCSFTDLHNSYRMGIPTMRQIVRHVCCSIWNILRKEYLPDLSQKKLESTAEGFENRTKFPHCIGAIDAKQIRINGGSLNFNDKDFSLVLLAITDSEYRFISVDIEVYGKDYDSTIFKNCSVWKAIQNNLPELPNPRPLIAESTENVPYVFVSNEAFALSNNLLRPFEGSDLTVTEKIFNYRLGRVRIYAESTFGVLSNKWRIFHQALNVSPDFAVDIVKACVILHNFVREHDGYNFEDTLTIVGLEDVEPEQSMEPGSAANGIRNLFADYFVSESGSLPWQLSRI